MTLVPKKNYCNLIEITVAELEIFHKGVKKHEL